MLEYDALEYQLCKQTFQKTVLYIRRFPGNDRTINNLYVTWEVRARALWRGLVIQMKH
jgi:hypothetical protein